MPDAGDIFRMVVGYAMPDEQVAANVIGLKILSGTATDAEFITALSAFIADVYSNIQTLVSNAVDLDESRVVQMAFAAGEWITSRVLGTFTPAFTSIDSTDMLPHAASPVITLPTNDPRRKGKVKLTGFTEATQQASIMETAALSAMTDFAADLRAGFTAGTAVVEYAVLGDDGVARSSTGFIIRNIIGSQRSRKPGVGI